MYLYIVRYFFNVHPFLHVHLSMHIMSIIITYWYFMFILIISTNTIMVYLWSENNFILNLELMSSDFKIVQYIALWFSETISVLEAIRMFISQKSIRDDIIYVSLSLFNKWTIIKHDKQAQLMDILITYTISLCSFKSLGNTLKAHL